MLARFCLPLILLLPSVTRAQDAFFDKTIAPLLARRCLECHAGLQPKGKLDLTTAKSARAGGKHGPAVVPGKLDASLLWEHVSDGSMPPKKPLTGDEKAAFKKWILDGAAWAGGAIDPYRFTSDARAGYDWWVLQPVARPALPAVKDAAWCKSPLDRFILAKLEAKGLAPSPQADPRTLLRRQAFDLTGLPPAPDDVEAFAKAWHAEGATEVTRRLSLAKAADRMLASPAYGERWGRHWLDIVRFGESHGFEHDEIRRTAWPYRDWVIDAFNRDLPFDEFSRLQIAGDALRPGDAGATTATGFLVAGAYDSVGQSQQSAPMRAVVRQDELEDVTGTIGQTFLGLTVQCARCHDHKFDPIRQEEYYRLTAALAGVRHGERAIESTNDSQRKVAEERQRRLAEIAKQLDAIEAPIRATILAERRKQKTPAKITAPIARWDFTRSLEDQIGGLHVELKADAEQTRAGLAVGGKTGHALSAPLRNNVKARTFAAWVKLNDLNQRGGAVISLQSLDGGVFDAIVFGEREPGRWMAGSDGFQRTKDFAAPPETDANKQFVHVAISYHDDGTITGYRNGVPYGKPYKAAPALAFVAGKHQVVFGLRHSPASPGKMLAGVIRSAELYDRPLQSQEVAALAGAASDFVGDDEITERLPPDQRALRSSLHAERSQSEAALKQAQTKRMVYAVSPRPPEPSHVLLRGNPGEKAAKVTAGGVASLVSPSAEFGLSDDATDAQRRVKLAEYVTHPKNPLFARVIANRVWHYHFGVGLVDTPSDFGFNGGRPSHPELLDWLAAELVEHGWSLKHLHRVIVASATYQQSGRIAPHAVKIDTGNRLLWRKAPMRLEAEAVRDAMLSVAGQLNPLRGGPGFQDFKITVRGATHTYTPIDVDSPEVFRRSVYRTWARGGRSNLLDTFDCPDPSTTTPRRAVTTTPLQALSLLNNTFVLRMADRFAERLRKEAGDGAAQQVARAYELAYSRPVTLAETAAAQRVVREHGLPVLCRAIFNSNEFVFVD